MKRNVQGSELRNISGLRITAFLSLLAVLFASALTPASAESRTETRNYLGVDDWVCYGLSPERSGCFDLDGTEKKVTLTLADATGLENAYAKVVFLNNRAPISGTSTSFCGSTTLSIPAGATHVEVNPSWWGSLYTQYCAPATTGTITAVFTS